MRVVHFLCLAGMFGSLASCQSGTSYAEPPAVESREMPDLGEVHGEDLGPPEEPDVNYDLFPDIDMSCHAPTEDDTADHITDYLVTFSIPSDGSELSMRVVGNDPPLVREGVALEKVNDVWTVTLCMPSKYRGTYYYEADLPADEGDDVLIDVRHSPDEPTHPSIEFDTVNWFEWGTCVDGVKNGTELGVDCGGSQCLPCLDLFSSLTMSDDQACLDVTPICPEIDLLCEDAEPEFGSAYILSTSGPDRYGFSLSTRDTGRFPGTCTIANNYQVTIPLHADALGIKFDWGILGSPDDCMMSSDESSFSKITLVPSEGTALESTSDYLGDAYSQTFAMRLPQLAQAEVTLSLSMMSYNGNSGDEGVCAHQTYFVRNMRYVGDDDDSPCRDDAACLNGSCVGGKCRRPLSQELVGIWDFEDDLQSTGDSSMTLSMVGANTSPSFRTGKSGQGIAFDGIEGRYVRNNITFNTEHLTFSFWLKLSEWPSSNRTCPVGLGTEHPTAGTHDKDVYVDAEGKLTFYTASSTDGQVYTTPSDPLAIETWYHITAVADGPDSFLYINGELAGSAMDKGNNFTRYNSQIPNFILGGTTYLSPVPFKGVIDTLKVWNRSLTASDVQDVFEASTP